MRRCRSHTRPRLGRLPLLCCSSTTPPSLRGGLEGRGRGRCNHSLIGSILHLHCAPPPQQATQGTRLQIERHR